MNEPRYDENTFQFTFGKLLNKNIFGYLLFGYALCIFGAIAAVAWKLKGYNKPTPKFSQMVNTWKPKDKPIKSKTKQTANGGSEAAVKRNGVINAGTEETSTSNETEETEKTK
ncbi:uncharacterized protein LOC100178232 [Ciona intestinalis]